MAAPPSQTYRRIVFRLEGGATKEAPAATFAFSVRPEELVRTEPSRLSVQQTLGGAWIDSFGRGIGRINLSGHNGWRGGLLLSGEDQFLALRDTVFVGWHRRRDEVIQAGKNPNDEISLFFTDSLDNIAVKVAPDSFTLRRSRSSPLLLHYNISLTELGDASEAVSTVDMIVAALSNPLRFIAGVTGLGDTLNTINSYAQTARAALGAISHAVQQFVNVGTSLITGIVGIASAAKGVFTGTEAALLSVGATFMRAASNAFGALVDTTLPPNQLIPVMRLASAFNDASCVMRTAFTVNTGNPDTANFFGASGCSSTGGGDPPSPYLNTTINPFATIFPPLPSSISVSPDARAAINVLIGDPIPLIGKSAFVGNLMAAAANGVILP